MSKFIGNNQYSGLSVEDRFWQKVNKRDDDECWEWQGSTHHQWGYGHFKFNGVVCESHRISWEFCFGGVPKGLQVLHHCDNPSCVNPNHLFWGTHQDNMKDRNEKNRQAKPIGTKNGRAILDEDKVRKIFILRKAGKHTRKEIAQLFGVSKPTIDAVLSRRNWGFVEVNDGNIY